MPVKVRPSRIACFLQGEHIAGKGEGNRKAAGIDITKQKKKNRKSEKRNRKREERESNERN